MENFLLSTRAREGVLQFALECHFRISNMPNFGRNSFESYHKGESKVKVMGSKTLILERCCTVISLGFLSTHFGLWFKIVGDVGS